MGVSRIRRVCVNETMNAKPIYRKVIVLLALLRHIYTTSMVEMPSWSG